MKYYVLLLILLACAASFAIAKIFYSPELGWVVLGVELVLIVLYALQFKKKV